MGYRSIIADSCGCVEGDVKGCELGANEPSMSTIDASQHHP